MTPNEALVLLLDENLSKDQYCGVRDQLNDKGTNILPCYQRVAGQKWYCRPHDIVVSETKAEVSLQILLAHTAARLVRLQEEVINNVMEEQGVHSLSASLVLSYGFDGSSGQSNYNQKYLECPLFDSDSSIFATTVTPSRLVDASHNIIWNNRTPQSIRFCRPLKLEFFKETRDAILRED